MDRTQNLNYYDLQNDPSEEKNMAKNYPEIVNKIELLMNESYIESSAYPTSRQ